MQRPPLGEILSQVGRGDHMQTHLQVWGGAMWSDSPKKAEIGQGPLRGLISWIIPCYESQKYIVAGGISGIDAVRDQSDRR